MKFKKKAEGLWGSDDGFFGSVLIHNPGFPDYNKHEYKVFLLIKDEEDDLDPEYAVQSESLTAKTQKAAVESAEKLYDRFLDRIIEAAQSAKK